jgi:hypothetical protein
MCTKQDHAVTGVLKLYTVYIPPDYASDLSGYKVIILPDKIPVHANLAQKLQIFLDRGGSLIASFESGMNLDAGDFARQALGVRRKSEGPRDLNGELVRGKRFSTNDYAEYILPGQSGKGLAQTEYTLYTRGMDIEAEPGAETLANKISSYFDRTYRHFSRIGRHLRKVKWADRP